MVDLRDLLVLQNGFCIERCLLGIDLLFLEVNKWFLDVMWVGLEVMLLFLDVCLWCLNAVVFLFDMISLC